MPDHLSVLKAVGDLDFLLNTKYLRKYLHHSITHSILYNTNQLVSNNIYRDNHHFVRVYPMINFVLDSSAHACYQKDSKLAYLASEQLIVSI